MYLSLLPQFIQPDHGSVLLQSFALGLTQLVVGISMNALITLSAASISALLAKRPGWQRLQRWLMGSVLAGLAVHMLIQRR
jgi:threonine/homoserine/homoserine lactone efflux protein